jgi:hypothetical protein
MVNGTQTNEFWWINAQSGRELRFGFSDFTRRITEAKWYQDTAATHGDWKWQGSNDGSTWTDIGTSFTLGGTLQTITTLSGNASYWHYYRLLQVSGVTSSGPWLREIEFNIDDGGGVALPLNAQMTQIAMDEWAAVGPVALLTQVSLEQWGAAAPAALTTQVAVEQWANMQGQGTFSATHI